MTTAEQFRSAISQPTSEISVAGVPWPAYKVMALLVGLVVFGVVLVVTASASPAVLSGAASASVVWLGLGLLHRHR
ncbi:MAG: hypothetical protein K0R68_2919 [Mycobacterium sp.]|jgi:hypothetical protein|nr:hypothetical protein [Mycobacterium sp.]